MRAVLTVLGRWVAALCLLASVMAALMMVEASRLLGLVQSEGQSAYTMDAFTRLPIPYSDDRVVEALRAWRAAVLVDPGSGSFTVDGTLLGLVRESVAWHVRLDVFLLAPAIAFVLGWFCKRALPNANMLLTYSLPALYLLADWAETLRTWWVVDGYLHEGTPVLRGTELLVLLTALKWLFLILAILVIILGSLSKKQRLSDSKRLGRALLAVRVQVVAVAVFAALIALPIAGPMDQIPDLLRSTHDESLGSPAVLIPLALVLAFSAAIWLTSRLILGSVSIDMPRKSTAQAAQDPPPLGPAQTSQRDDQAGEPTTAQPALERHPSADEAHARLTEPASAPVREPGSEPATEDTAEVTGRSADGEPELKPMVMPPALRYGITRVAWFVVVVVLAAAGATARKLGGDALHPSPAVYAAAIVTGVLLLLDLVLAALVRWGAVSTEITGRPTRLREGDAHVLARLVVVLTCAPLLILGLGVVRAYGPIVLPQSGIPDKAVHEGATSWFWGGAIGAVVVPLAVAAVLTRFVVHASDPKEPAELRTRSLAVRVVSVVLLVLLLVLAAVTSLHPSSMGPYLEALGVLTLWLASIVIVFGVVQWLAERTLAVPLARVVGLQRTPLILVVVVIALVAGSMDSRVGYHAVTLKENTPAEQTTLSKAYQLWLDDAQDCRGDDATLPLLLVAAPGGGARAAYWTGQVMASLRALDACEGDSVFAASGVSGGSVGLAVWSVTDEPLTTKGALEGLVTPDALDATVATMLFRDLPRSFTGLHPEGVDRAAVEQEVWIEKATGLDEAFYVARTEDWSPVLMLNASDIRTGCKVVLSQVAIEDPNRLPAAQRCQLPPTADNTRPTALQGGAVDAAQFLDDVDCELDDTAKENDPPQRHNVSLAAAALLSARFPYVSPSGALTACMERSREHLFIADGGYLENTGIHTLLATWEELEPLIAKTNAGDGPRVLPIALLVDNHYRARATTRLGGRVRELTGPPNADRTALLRSESLEQAMAAEFSATVLGMGAYTSRWYVIAPTVSPGVSAPLGWSLSNATREELDCQMPAIFRAAYDADSQETVAGTTGSDETGSEEVVAKAPDWSDCPESSRTERVSTLVHLVD